MLMTNKAILKGIQEKRITISNFSKECLFHTSYNIRLGRVLRFFDKKIEEIDLAKKKSITIEPKSYVVCRSYEKIKIDSSIHAFLGGKSDLVNKGLVILNGLVIDPSFDGYLEFGLFNVLNRRVKLVHKEKMLKIVFDDISQLAFNEKWLPKNEKKKWDRRSLDKFALNEMQKRFYQGN